MQIRLALWRLQNLGVVVSYWQTALHRRCVCALILLLRLRVNKPNLGSVETGPFVYLLRLKLLLILSYYFLLLLVVIRYDEIWIGRLLLLLRLLRLGLVLGIR